MLATEMIMMNINEEIDSEENIKGSKMCIECVCVCVCVVECIETLSENRL